MYHVRLHITLPFFIVCLLGAGLLKAQAPSSGQAPAATPVALPAAYTNTTINFVRTWEPSMPSADPAVVTAAGRTTAE